MSNRCAKIYFALALFATPTLVHAYIDPGTGSLLIQGLIALVVGALFTLKTWWHRLRSLFARRPPPQPPAESPSGKASE